MAVKSLWLNSAAWIKKQGQKINFNYLVMNWTVLLHGRDQRIPSMFNQMLPARRCIQSESNKLLTSSHLSPRPQTPPYSIYTWYASQETLLEQDWYLWPPTYSTVCQQRRTDFCCRACSFQWTIIYPLMTTGLFQKGHFEHLATFGAPNHMTQVSRRWPWHRAHLGSP